MPDTTSRATRAAPRPPRRAHRSPSTSQAPFLMADLTALAERPVPLRDQSPRVRRRGRRALQHPPGGDQPGCPGSLSQAAHRDLLLPGGERTPRIGRCAASGPSRHGGSHSTRHPSPGRGAERHHDDSERRRPTVRPTRRVARSVDPVPVCRCPFTHPRRLSMAELFSPLTLRSVTLRNRIAMSPMCMYSAGEDGIATDFHLAHLAARAVGGAGLVITEAAAVEARGRISVNDLGLWNDAQIEPLARIVRLGKAQGAVMCTQLAHAGRKAWTPTKGRGPFPAVAPSAIAFDAEWTTPHELTVADLDGIVAAFRTGAQRAMRAGFDAVEVHGAHGYLLHQFISPLSNRRADQYGGSLENRARMLLRVVDAVRAELGETKPLLVRLSCSDWIEGGVTIEDQVQVARWLKAHGADLVGLLVRRQHLEGPASRAGVSGALRGEDPARGRHRDHGGRTDHDTRNGRGDRAKRPRGCGGARPRAAPEPVLAAPGRADPGPRPRLADPVSARQAGELRRGSSGGCGTVEVGGRIPGPRGAPSALGFIGECLNS